MSILNFNTLDRIQLLKENLAQKDKEIIKLDKQIKGIALFFKKTETSKDSESKEPAIKIINEPAEPIVLHIAPRSFDLEADRVFILAPETMYHERAMRIDWMAEQEANLVYVAYTRAKHYLGFITDYDYEK